MKLKRVFENTINLLQSEISNIFTPTRKVDWVLKLGLKIFSN